MLYINPEKLRLIYEKQRKARIKKRMNPDTNTWSESNDTIQSYEYAFELNHIKWNIGNRIF